jgi:hypothetical protein
MALKRQQILDAMKTRLQLINGSTPYYLNASANVYIQRDKPFESWSDRELPGINIVDGDEEPGQELLSGAVNVWYRDLNVAVQLVTGGALADTLVRKGIADIQRAIGTDLTWGGLAIDTDWVNTTIERDQQEQRIMSATVNIKISYSTTQWSEE